MISVSTGHPYCKNYLCLKLMKIWKWWIWTLCSVWTCVVDVLLVKAWFVPWICCSISVSCLQIELRWACVSVQWIVAHMQDHSYHGRLSLRQITQWYHRRVSRHSSGDWLSTIAEVNTREGSKHSQKFNVDLDSCLGGRFCDFFGIFSCCVFFIFS